MFKTCIWFLLWVCLLFQVYLKYIFVFVYFSIASYQHSECEGIFVNNSRFTRWQLDWFYIACVLTDVPRDRFGLVFTPWVNEPYFNAVRYDLRFLRSSCRDKEFMTKRPVFYQGSNMNWQKGSSWLTMRFVDARISFINPSHASRL